MGSGVVGLSVTGSAVVGFSVAGLAVVGFSVVGLAVVGSPVEGTAVVGLSVVGFGEGEFVGVGDVGAAVGLGVGRIILKQLLPALFSVCVGMIV